MNCIFPKTLRYECTLRNGSTRIYDSCIPSTLSFSDIRSIAAYYKWDTSHKHIFEYNFPDAHFAKNKAAVSKYILKAKDITISSSKHCITCEASTYIDALPYIERLHKINSSLNGICLEYIFYECLSLHKISLEEIFIYFKKHKNKFRHKRCNYEALWKRYSKVLTEECLDKLSIYFTDIQYNLGINVHNISMHDKTSLKIGRTDVFGAIDFIQNGNTLYDIKVNTKNYYTQWKRQLMIYSMSMKGVLSMRVINLYNNQIIMY